MAAGLGFKTFTTGEVLTAADVNGYLMQGILVFASAAARDAAITSPQEGQFAYLKDTNVTTYYTGSAWANVDTTGMTNPMTTTGDIIYSSSGSTPARLGIGTAGQVLKVNSGATAPEWAAAGGGKVLQVVQATTSSGVTISSVTYTDTGLTASITPSATNSKVLVMISQQMLLQSDQTAGYGVGAKILRGATTIVDNSSSSVGVFFIEAGNGANGRMGLRGYYSQNYLDSPSTTSSTTYKVQMAANTTAGTSAFLTQSNACVSSIILMEIGA